MKRVLTLVLPILFTVFALAACSSGNNDSSSPPASADQASGPEIVADDYTFSVSGTFAPGEEVTIRNNDDVEHSVTSDDPNNPFEEVEIHPGETKTLTVPDQPGSYAFHCRYHPFMMSSFTVQ
ncbi:hypothetical protein BFN03_08010 [Rhodococcus sp. WMMA185]|uniref:cupredoxin domain-containing protein n=1 Tax=Rhodococcus sp. WMMA185 TaxID=679318 RepID=UPI000878B9CC|nr:cupredoxin domain-containing protein [Rhodococcus sp. WMMA185]AOW94618.1 hypothetical protein BFN03_08010 [Rhodococcus sp. WMMA185]